jgi:signal transduction histidine kinase
MQERAQALDGQVRVDTAPGKGTRVVIEVKN